MKKIVFGLLVVVSLYAETVKSLVKELEHLKPHQKEILFKTYNAAKPLDMQWTMTAIAWRESQFGRDLVGRTTPDFGVFQININTFKNRHKRDLKRFPVNDKKLKRMLKNDYDLGFSCALEELEYWKSVRGNDWRKIWGSYNGGYKPNERYAEWIYKRIKALKIYIKSHSHEHFLIANYGV